MKITAKNELLLSTSATALLPCVNSEALDRIEAVMSNSTYTPTAPRRFYSRGAPVSYDDCSSISLAVF